MVRRLAALGLLVALLSAAPAAPALAAGPRIDADATSGELVLEPKKWNGRVITYGGEAVGEAMVRGDMAWIHVNDDAYFERNIEEGAELGGYNSGQAIWLPAPLARRIDTFGGYSHEGSVVRVRGTFNAACAEHGGDMDIHATALEVVRPGHRVVDVVRPLKALAALLLALLAGGLWVLERKLRNRVYSSVGRVRSK